MLRFAIKNMAIKKSKLILVTLSIVLSAAVALVAYNVSSQVNDGIVSTAGYYDMIIGPAGSSTQLAMNTMFFTDTPLGTIPYSLVEELQANPDVNEVIPFTMGDSYNGARIVGTVPAFLNGKPLKEGRMFEDTYEAVLGADVASKYNLKVGDEIVTSHGLAEAGHEHAASPFKIVGILDTTNTAYDNVVFTSYKTVWAVHGLEEEEEHEHEHEEEAEAEHAEEEVTAEEEITAEATPAIDTSNIMSHGTAKEETHEDEDEHDHDDDDDDGEVHVHDGTVCAILVKTKSFNSYYALSQYYGNDSSLLVINPATVLREVLDNVDLSSKIVYILCAIILVMNIFVITVITLLNLYDAKREISLMRLIGISMGRISALYTIQNAIIGLISVVLAMLASMGCLALMRDFVASMGIVLSVTRVYPLEWAIMAIVFVISVLPTMICVWSMARKDSVGGK